MDCKTLSYREIRKASIRYESIALEPLNEVAGKDNTEKTMEAESATGFREDTNDAHQHLSRRSHNITKHTNVLLGWVSMKSPLN